MSDETLVVDPVIKRYLMWLFCDLVDERTQETCMLTFEYLFTLARDLDEYYFKMLHRDEEFDDPESRSLWDESVSLGAAMTALLDTDDFNSIMLAIPGCILVCSEREWMQEDGARLSFLYERLKDFSMRMQKADVRFRPKERINEENRER